MAQRGGRANDGRANGGVLGWIERTGNRLPDPVFIFFYLIAALVVISVLASVAGYSALHPTQHDAHGAPVLIAATSLLAPENIRRLWADMPLTFTGFHPLGYVLVVMLGAGIAERTGLFAAAMRGAVHGAPKALLTPMVALVAMMGNLAADAAYVVLIPLAGILYAAAGRHPIAGIACAFAGVSGAFSANLLPGQLDALLFGITEAAAEALVPAGREHRRQLVFHIGHDARVPAGDLVRHRSRDRAAPRCTRGGRCTARTVGRRAEAARCGAEEGACARRDRGAGRRAAVGLVPVRPGYAAAGPGRAGPGTALAVLQIAGRRLLRAVPRLRLGLRRGGGCCTDIATSCA